MFRATEDDMEITAMSFDPTKRKLITGARDGVVKIWNFNNGACLRILQEPDGSEVRYIKIYKKTQKECSICHQTGKIAKSSLTITIAKKT